MKLFIIRSMEMNFLCHVRIRSFNKTLFLFNIKKQADRVGYFDFLRKYVTMKCVKKRRKADGTYILYRSY